MERGSPGGSSDPRTRRRGRAPSPTKRRASATDVRAVRITARSAGPRVRRRAARPADDRVPTPHPSERRARGPHPPARPEHRAPLPSRSPAPAPAVYARLHPRLPATARVVRCRPCPAAVRTLHRQRNPPRAGRGTIRGTEPRAPSAPASRPAFSLPAAVGSAGRGTRRVLPRPSSASSSNPLNEPTAHLQRCARRLCRWQPWPTRPAPQATEQPTRPQTRRAGCVSITQRATHAVRTRPPDRYRRCERRHRDTRTSHCAGRARVHIGCPYTLHGARSPAFTAHGRCSHPRLRQ
jgi:hypothetical protein